MFLFQFVVIYIYRCCEYRQMQDNKVEHDHVPFALKNARDSLADTTNQEQNMVRIHYKSKGDHAGSFMSHPMTREAAITKAAEMRNDPDLYDIEIRED